MQHEKIKQRFCPLLKAKSFANRHRLQRFFLLVHCVCHRYSLQRRQCAYFLWRWQQHLHSSKFLPQQDPWPLFRELSSKYWDPSVELQNKKFWGEFFLDQCIEIFNTTFISRTSWTPKFHDLVATVSEWTKLTPRAVSEEKGSGFDRWVNRRCHIVIVEAEETTHFRRQAQGFMCEVFRLHILEARRRRCLLFPVFRIVIHTVNVLPHDSIGTGTKCPLSDRQPKRQNAGNRDTCQQSYQGWWSIVAKGDSLLHCGLNYLQGTEVHLFLSSLSAFIFLSLPLLTDPGHKRLVCHPWLLQGLGVIQKALGSRSHGPVIFNFLIAM